MLIEFSRSIFCRVRRSEYLLNSWTFLSLYSRMMFSAAELHGEGERMTIDGGAAGESKRPIGMGIGERNRMLAARRGDDRVTDKTSIKDGMDDVVENWVMRK